ncbi:hypothetical protein [Caldisalinibacter kiritimatiensis]|uniref:Uncharacterized protein n=1 Tax=Caldisalinibacter kiritimatiensis TaxID=1304284 RepID=R1CC39_9FIRM|nr:hypothetical protein [Caldisalinibacter kiritimatiensis]EOC99869.1 hypothetical protein L21TH_2093 [Caldisalinibacter kiritimatiensis]
MTIEEKYSKIKELQKKIDIEHEKGNYCDNNVIDMIVECANLIAELENSWAC